MNLLAFIIAMLFGAVQMLFLSILLRSVTSGNTKGVIKALLVKLVLYAAAIALLLLKFPESIINCACGYAAGLPISAVIYFIYLSYFKKS